MIIKLIVTKQSEYIIVFRECSRCSFFVPAVEAFAYVADRKYEVLLVAMSASFFPGVGADGLASLALAAASAEVAPGLFCYAAEGTFVFEELTLLLWRLTGSWLVCSTWKSSIQNFKIKSCSLCLVLDFLKFEFIFPAVAALLFGALTP